MGSERSSETKAENDYTKRTADSLGLAVADTTFVFVTPRPWAGRIQWQNEKRASKTWKDVRVINADALELWLESTPAVALWLARQIGKVVSTGIRDLEAVWEEWSIGTKPVMTPALVIGGRVKDVEVIQKWITDRPRILEVQGDHPDEALAFLYASIATLPETDKAQALARCIVLENINELRQVTQAFQNYPLIIAAPGECLNAASLAVAKGHHVFISMDATVVGIRDIVRLARPQREVVERVLREGGLSDADAQRLARDSGRSIPVLRRHLFQSNAVSAPAWANAESARIVLPVLLANAWVETKDGDREVIETLSGMSHDAFIKELTPFLSMDDSPIHKVGSVWMIKSPLDAWFLLAPHLTHDYLKLFDQALLGVLTKTDPKYDLEAEQRWAAAIYGKSNPYSEWLRTCLVESLVLLAVYGNRSPHILSTQAFADHVVREVFTNAATWEAWASIKDATPLLSEASPDTFIEAVEQVLTQTPTIFQELMKDDSGVFGECRHSGLLWALESMAWSPEYFARAVNVLAELAKIDPGGRWSNRAINSIRDVFLPTFPQTYATPEERLAALDSLIAKFPVKVWAFAMAYFGGGSVSESHRFRWRDAAGNRRGLEPEDVESNRNYITNLLPKLGDLAVAKENLIGSTRQFTQLPNDIRDRLLEVLEKTEPAAFSKDERAQLLQCIREVLNWTNSYGDEEPRKNAPALDRVLERFTPTDAIERVGWLLSTPWPRLPQGEPEEYDSKDTAVKTAQQEAAREVLDQAPFGAFFDELRRYTSSPMALHRVLQKDPLFFAYLITLVYKQHDKAPDLTRGDRDEEMAERRALVTREVLDSWYLVPGLKDDGTLDERELTEWVEAARTKCAGTGHAVGGDLEIGFILAHAPADVDGVWPHVAVRNLIERLNNEIIDRHIQNEIHNSRGVTSRGLKDGGKQERVLAEKYKRMSDAVKAKWPRTGAMLRSMAETYEHQAKREDIDSDLHDLRWD